MASPEANQSELMLELMSVMHKLAIEFNRKYGGCHIGTNVGSYQSTKHMHWYIHAGQRVRDRDGNLIEEIDIH